MNSRRYVLCGLSARAISHFVLPLAGKTGAPEGNDFRDCAVLTAVLDIDRGRVEALNERLGLALKWYHPESFDEMIARERPDTVLVAGPDDTHFGHIMHALDRGCDVIAEKPMVLSAAEAAQVLAKERETRRRVTVSFNMRYKPFLRAVRRLLMQGAIGRVVNIEFNYNLDTAHGSSYFLRWNRVRQRSGGLSVHKSCHHFDVVNWWLADRPATVFAFGARNFYGPDGAHRPRTAAGGELSPAETRQQCPYYRKHYASPNRLDAGSLVPDRGRVSLPYEVQYPPEKPVYLYDDEIDVEDTYSATVRYRHGALLSYSINFSAAWEGLNVGLNGTHGRIEGSYRVPPGESADSLRVLPLFGDSYVVPLEKGVGSHGGADAPLQRDLFRGVSPESRELGLMADSVAGAYAVAAGEAVWRSCLSGQPVAIPRFE
jgi:predicted dehydrogenase